MDEEKGLTIAITGATGFVGTALARHLGNQYRLVLLSRTKQRTDSGPSTSEWRTCDLFSLIDAEAALVGVDIAFYLVHAMMPSARLTQGVFENLDLIAADNFARAAAKCNVQQIIYLGGLIPQGVPLSRHLKSRLEVEKALQAYKTPVTTLRAGLIIGENGSSFQILYRLVKKLPILVCPNWTKTETQPVSLNDVIELLSYCIQRRDTYQQCYDIGGPDIVTYRELLTAVAEQLKLKRYFLPVPFFSPGLSRLWVTLITGAPRALVSPLVQSLKYPMVTRDRRLQALANVPGIPLVKALQSPLTATETASATPLAFRGGTRTPKQSQVRSVQRFRLPPGKNAMWVATEYIAWLPRTLLSVQVMNDGKTVNFLLPFWDKPLLILSYSPERSSPDRSLFYIRGGILARVQGRGRFEFRESWDHRFVFAAVHEFHPSLPWWLYSLTQAPLHAFVMWAFGRYLKKLSLQGSKTS